MKRTPEAEDWQRLIELTESGEVKDDDSLIALDAVCRFDSSRGLSLLAWYRWVLKKSHRPASSLKPEPVVSLDILSARTPDRNDLCIPIRGDADARMDADTVRKLVGQAPYAVLVCRYMDGLSVTATAKLLSMSRESVSWIEAESLRLIRASLACEDDNGYGGVGSNPG